jgi:UDP:flavonoid glycosyltransferase YjiC (YdhE family)
MKLSDRAKNYLKIAGLGAGAIVGIALAGNREVKADVSGMMREAEMRGNAEDIDAMMRNYNETFGTKLGHSSTHSKTN